VWYLWRAGPGDDKVHYLTSFPSLDATVRVVLDIAEGKKVVRRNIEDGVQFIIKEHETTLQSLLRAVTYYAKKDDCRTPTIKPLEFAGKDGAVQPGGKLPSPYFKVDP